MEILKTVKTNILDAWEDTPWIRAGGVIGFTFAGLVFLNQNLPDEIALNITDGTIKDFVLVSVVVLYFFLVAIFSGDRLRFEKKLRLMGQSFKYDKRGTLYNGGEPNIAFRIATFKGILQQLTTDLGDAKVYNSFISAGREASKDFSCCLENIYNTDISTLKRWEDLPITEKLNHWADYDSATGWGIITCNVSKANVNVVINHLQGLFDGPGGIIFCHFLAGYCETIVGHIVGQHRTGKYQDISGCELVAMSRGDKYSLTLEYKLT